MKFKIIQILQCLLLASVLLFIADVQAEDSLKLEGCSPTVILTDNINNALKVRLVDMVKIRNRACETLNNSRKHASRANFFFRVFGLTTIILSALIPFISVFDKHWKQRTLSAMAVIIAISTGVNSFFDFQGTWAKSRMAQYVLRYEIISWEQDISEAVNEKNTDKAIVIAETATSTLKEAWKDGVIKRGNQYFKQSFKM